MRLQSRFRLSTDLNLSPFKYFSTCQSRSLSLLCQRPNNQIMVSFHALLLLEEVLPLSRAVRGKCTSIIPNTHVEM